MDLSALLPTPAYLLGAVLFGIYGWMAYRRGKKVSSQLLKWSGLALMLYPYAITETWLLWLVGAGLSVWVYLKWE